jgi:hypothetical protein
MGTYKELADKISSSPSASGALSQVFALEPGGDLGAAELIVGVAIGSASDSTNIRGLPGESLLRLYVSQDIPPESAAEMVGAAFGVETLASGEVPFEVVHTGPIDLLAHRMRMRPAPCGISCGHIAITAGTLGSLAQGRKAPRNGKTLILSNNHVLANINAGKAGDAILQSGPIDGGKNPADLIARLERFVNIDFSPAAANYVDCATAEADPAVVRADQLFLKGGVPTYFKCGTTPRPAVRGLTVGKSGRTTQLTSGRVTAIGATIRVSMPGGRTAVFRDQIEIRGLTGDFSQGGDSGSLIWTWDEKRDPVALLFAGGGGRTFANPINHVLAALDIDLL